MRSLLLSGILFCLLTASVQAQIVQIQKGRPTAKGITRPDYLVQIKVDSVGPVIGLRGQHSISDWGTGSLVDPQHVLTAKHNVVAKHDAVYVGFKNGDIVKAEVLARHPNLDLLILRLKDVRYEKPLELHPEVRRVRPGQEVYSIGFHGGYWDCPVNEYRGKAQNAILNIAGIQLAEFRYNGMADVGISGGPTLVDGKLVGVERATGPLGIHATNTPEVRKFLERIK